MNPIVNRSAILLTALWVAGCGKDPDIGQSPAHESTVKDGQVVLVRSGKQYGAFLIRNQRIAAGVEQMDYMWFYRFDGLGTFRTNDAAVSFGIQSNAQQISFGPFQVPWSVHSNGCGFAYYSLLPNQKGTPAYELCPTTEQEVQGIDARAPLWRFRERGAFSVPKYVRENTPEELRGASRMVDATRPWSPSGQNLNPTPGEPGGAANGSQPIRSETNQPSGAAGSRR